MIRRMRWVGYVEVIGDKWKAYRIFVGNPERIGPLERPRHRCKDNIKMDFKEIFWGGRYWIYLIRYRDQYRALVNTIVNIWAPLLNS
jgi:hypothetical protein